MTSHAGLRSLVVLALVAVPLVAAAPPAAATSCEVLEEPVDGAKCIVYDYECMVLRALRQDCIPL